MVSHALTILPDATVKRSTVEREDLKPCTGNQLKGLISGGAQQAYCSQVIQRFHQTQEDD